MSYLENEADERRQKVCSKDRVKHSEINDLSRELIIGVMYEL